MSRPLLLDLFCGAGGASMGYHQAGFEVIGVDIAPQPRYPFRFIQADALHLTPGPLELVELNDIVCVHASPPCQPFTAYRRRDPDKVGEGYEDLIERARELLITLKNSNSQLEWVIENVGGAPLYQPIQLCGSSFGLDIRRHRYFESSVRIEGKPCDHEWQTPRFPPASNRTNLRRTVEVGVKRIPLEVQKRAMGIDWMQRRELSQAIPPAYTEWIGRQLWSGLII